MIFYFFVCLLWLGLHNTLNKSGKTRFPCLAPDLEAVLSAVDFDVNCGLVIYGLHYVEICYLGIHIVEHYGQCILNFAKCFFCISWDEHVTFIFHFVNVLYHDWFADTEPSLYTWSKSTWLWCVIILMYCWIWCVSILLRSFCMCSSWMLACGFLFLLHICLVLVSG